MKAPAETLGLSCWDDKHYVKRAKRAGVPAI